MPDFPSELVEAAAKALAGEPRCYCPDDWRADPSPRCPFHGDGEWPTYAHYLQARAVLAAVVPLIERAERDRLAKQAGEPPPRPHIFSGFAGRWVAVEDAERWAACGVAAERERVLREATSPDALKRAANAICHQWRKGESYEDRAKAAIRAALPPASPATGDRGGGS